MQGQDINPATGKAWAINPATGVWDDNYWAQISKQFVSPSNQSTTQPSQSVQNPIDYAQQLLNFQKDANQPVVKSLQASIPEIGQKFTQQKTELQSQQPGIEARYKALVDEIKGNQAEEEKRTGISAAQELGRRGISAESGLYGQTVNQALAPVTRFYTGQTTQAGLSQEESVRQLQNLIAGLTPQQVEQQRQVQNAIAQLQAGNPGDAVSQALNLYNSQQTQAQNAAQLALKQQAQDLESQLQSVSLAYQQQRNPLELDLLRAQVASARNKGTGSGITAEEFLRQFGGILDNKTTPAVPSYFTPTPTVNLYKGMPGLSFG